MNISITYQKMQSKQSLNTPLSSSPQQNKRRAHMNRIRQSLQDVPLLSQNLNLARKKIPGLNSLETENNSRQSSTPESGSQRIVVQSYQLFDQKYQLLEKLGEGTNGVVRKCKRRQNGEIFAVKSFSFDDEHLPGLKSNFLIMKRLKHPNIIKYEALYIDLKKHQGWLVMEYAQLPSLEKVSVKSEEDIKNIMFQIIESLSYLHRQDIVHRDIKPENILYDPVSKTIKLVDFGISKRFRRRGTLIEMWTITGTLYYRAPEMFSGGYREHVDIWAAGILLYKLVTGKTPFESEYHHQTIQNIRGAELSFPPEFNRFSSDLKSLLTLMLSRNIEERPSSCTCIRFPWFSILYSSTASKKGENKLNDKTLQMDRQPTSTKCRLQAMMSLNAEETDSWELGEYALTQSVRPYVRKVNGQEYHIIDGEWK